MAAKARRRPRRKAARTVPLSWRLPNPPAVFVGRDADREWLVQALERAPVTVVAGPGGVGKTALVRQTLHRASPSRVDRTLFVDVPPGQPAGQVRQDVLRALAEASGVADIDWSEVQGAPDAAVAQALELAEAGPWWIAIDDLHQGEADEANEMLVQLASFARESRWIVTSRLSPRVPELAGQVLTLAGMSNAELAELAQAWAPGAEAAALRRALAAASGSPWLLHQLLVTGATEPALAADGLLRGLPEDAAQFLRGLALVEAPLPPSVLGLFTPTPGAGTLEALEQRGLVLRTPAGLRLHDVARGVLLDPGTGWPAVDERTAEHAAAVLAQHELPEAALEAARIWASAGRFDALAELLDRRGERIIAQGFAPRLWRVLSELSDPALTAWQLRCAAELGNPTALERVHRPARDGAAETLGWARTLRAQGEMDEAIGHARELLQREGAGEALRVDATFLLASCLRHVGALEEAERALASLDPEAPALLLRRDAESALVRSLGFERCEDLLRALRHRLHADPDAAEPARLAGEACLEAAMLPEAAELAELARPWEARPALLVQREALLLAARVALAQGRLEEARRHADAVRPYARGSSLLLPFLYEVDAMRRLAAGELEGLGPVIAAFATEVDGIDVFADARLASVRVRLATSLAEELPEDVPLAPSIARTTAGREAELLRAIHRIRHEGRSVELPETGDHRALSCLARMAEASAALCRGDFAEASTRAAEAARAAHRGRMRVLEAEARLLSCDALCCSDRAAEARAEADAVAALASEMGSRRFQLEAEARAAAASGALTPALLEKLAGLATLAPESARRAQALLGGDPALDHVDLRVLELLALGDAAGTFEWVRRPRLEGEDAPWQPAWGMDDRNGTVWLPDGRTVDLSGGGLSWRILQVIADAGGEASKELLARDAWREDDYHPLRHDGRLHVAVRKLRELIEDDPAAPRRLATAEDGYRLVGPLRRVR